MTSSILTHHPEVLHDHISDDEYSVSIKEAKYIITNILDVPVDYTILDIVEQVRVINNTFYYRLYKKSLRT